MAEVSLNEERRRFKSVSDLKLKESLDPFRKPRATFGVEYLDLCLGGIMVCDFILVGAVSGAGKTQFCTNLALANAQLGKRVHFISLEGYEKEIEHRMLYSVLTNRYWNDPQRLQVSVYVSFPNWLGGLLDKAFAPYLGDARAFLQDNENLKTYYKASTGFSVRNFKAAMMGIGSDTDLVIVDHAHFFDYDESQERQALKEIAMAARQLSQVLMKPIVLVAHLRKGNKYNPEICPGMDEFHGSSDLTKIATKVITIARGPQVDALTSGTYFRTPKNRFDGSVHNFLGCVEFDMRTQTYKSKFNLYKVSKDGQDAEALSDKEWPQWAPRPVVIAGGRPYRDD